MKVIDHINNNDNTQFSYEIIPPLRGKGIKDLNSSIAGDQLIHVNIWTPKKLTQEEEKILSQLKNSKNFKPSPGKSDKGFFEKVRDFMS